MNYVKLKLVFVIIYLSVIRTKNLCLSKIKNHPIMKYIYTILFSLSLLISFSIIAQTKIPLNHSVYDSWMNVEKANISNDGNYVSYQVDPQEGDGELFLYNTDSKLKSKFSRGYSAMFSPDSDVLIFKIKPQFDTIRKLKLKKVKKDKLPADSIALLDIKLGRLKKYPSLVNYKIPADKSNWVSFLMKQPDIKIANDSIKNDSTVNVKTKKSKSKKKKSNTLVILNPITNDSVSFKDVKKYSWSDNGLICSFVQAFGDSIDSVRVSYYNTNSKKTSVILNKEGVSENVSVDKTGKQLAFTYSADTVEEKAMELYYYNVNAQKLVSVSGDNFSNLTPGYAVSKNGNIYFNDDATELYFGINEMPITPLKDTLTEDEKVSVDIWNWKDKKLQTQQLKELEREKKRSYLAVYFPKSDKTIQLGQPSIKNIQIDKKANKPLSLAFDSEPYMQMISWEASRYKDVYLINRLTGESKLVLPKLASSVYLSLNQQYVLWYNIADSSWNSYNVKNNESINLTDVLGVNFYNELNDVPNEASPYGFAGWTKEGNPVVYDRFDLWMFDITGGNAPVNLTNASGRKRNIRYRYINLDKELRVLPSEILLSTFDYLNKDDGFSVLNIKKANEPNQLIFESFDFNIPVKAKKSNKIIWKKQSFKEFPELYLSNTDFTDIVCLTNLGNQKNNFIWGNVELVNWVSFNGDSLQGMLYTPENIDPEKKYPVIVYFYERYSDRLHYFHAPKPIRSVINFSYYVSNGYVIFVPDIIYKEGYPGPSAYDCIVSGTEAICNQFSFMDRSNIGIQGQSWGGYQVAYLVTQTNIYKAAMAGAPVSNMTSAYGGIRWSSGLSRAFQYEQTQSRIGGNLWEKLPLYLKNSPLFEADRIETPLLIMHNDKDGAVPWYQGIELFNALRRLNKPVWMLVYNGAPHNLKRRADCKDLTIRMQQFFDYYLKNEPEPVWMKYGVPALKKGVDYGFELTE